MHNRSAASAIALSIYVFGRTPASRHLPMLVGQGQVSRQGLSISATPIQQRGHTIAPRSSLLSMRLRTWSGWVAKSLKCLRKAYVHSESQQDE